MKIISYQTTDGIYNSYVDQFPQLLTTGATQQQSEDRLMKAIVGLAIDKYDEAIEKLLEGVSLDVWRKQDENAELHREHAREATREKKLQKESKGT